MGNYPESVYYKQAHKYPKGLKFRFEIDRKAQGTASEYYPKGKLAYLQITPQGKIGTDVSLIYLFEVSTLYGGNKFVHINAMTGEWLYDTTFE